MNPWQASLLRGRPPARFPGTPVVTPDGDGATVFIQHPDGLHLRVPTGNQPGVVLLALLGSDLRMVTEDTEDNA